MDTVTDKEKIDAEFKFDEMEHAYFLNGKRLPSVTQILKFANLVDDRFFTEEARARGTAVHKAIWYDIQNDLGEVHPAIEPYVQSWYRFRESTKIEPIMELCERPQFHPVYHYGGTPDIIAILNGRHVLIDIKSGTIEGAHFQTAAYWEMPSIRNLVPYENRFTLRLSEEGGLPKLKNYSDKTDLTVFLSALNLFKIKGGNP